MSFFETFLSVSLMTFIFGIFVSFVVLMGIFRAQEEAVRELKVREVRDRADGQEPTDPS